MNAHVDRLLAVSLSVIPVVITAPVIQAVTECSKVNVVIGTFAFFLGVPAFIEGFIGSYDRKLADRLFGWFVQACVVICLAVLVIGSLLPAFVSNDP